MTRLAVAVAALLLIATSSGATAEDKRDSCANIARVIDTSGAPPYVIDRSTPSDIEVFPERLLSGKSNFGIDKDLVRYAVGVIAVGPLLGTSDIDGPPKAELTCTDREIVLTVTLTYLDVAFATNTFAMRPAIELRLFVDQLNLTFVSKWVLRDKAGTLLSHGASAPGPDYSYPIVANAVIRPEPPLR